MYSNEISRLNSSTSTQASRLNSSTQISESNKKEQELVKLKVPFIGEPIIEFAKQDNLTALKSFRSTVSVESQVRIIGKLYNFHNLDIEFDESLKKYNAFTEKDFLATPMTAITQYLKVSMALDSRFLEAYAKLGLMKNDMLHKEVTDYLADKTILKTPYTSQNCGQELARLCDIVKPYLNESEKIVESRSKEIIGNYKHENDRLINQLNEAKRYISDLNERIEQLQLSKKETEANLVIAENKHEELTNIKILAEEKIAMSQENMADYFESNRSSLETEEVNSDKIKQEYENLMLHHRVLEQDYQKIDQHSKLLQSEIETLTNKLAFSNKSIVELELSKENSTKEFETLREELKLSRAAQESSELNIKNYKSEIVDLTARIVLKEKQSTDLSELKNQLEASELKNQELISKLAALLEIEKAYNALTESKEAVMEGTNVI
jgi:hypothetical protein